MTVMAGLGKLKSILRWWEFQMRTECEWLFYISQAKLNIGGEALVATQTPTYDTTFAEWWEIGSTKPLNMK